jgi:hypothetical protein
MSKKNITQKGRIPLCKSDFLQDVTIQLGQRMKSVRKANLTLSIVASIDKCGMERLDFTADSVPNRMSKLVLWEDGLAWFFERKNSKACRKSDFECYANFATFSPYELAEIIRSSLIDWNSAKLVWENYAHQRHSPEQMPSR